MVKELTGGKGADVIYDPVGGDLFDQCTRCVNWKGRILVVGFASGKIPQYPVNLALLKGCQLVGVFWGEFRGREPDVFGENCAELFEMYRTGKNQTADIAGVPVGEICRGTECVHPAQSCGENRSAHSRRVNERGGRDCEAIGGAAGTRGRNFPACTHKFNEAS